MSTGYHHRLFIDFEILLESSGVGLELFDVELTFGGFLGEEDLVLSLGCDCVVAFFERGEELEDFGLSLVETMLQ